MYRYVAFILLVLFSSPAFSGEWSGKTEIKKLYPHSTNNTDGTIYLSFGKMINPSGCGQTGLIALKKSNKLSQEIYSLLLTSYTAKFEVSYYAGGCDSHGYPVLLHIVLS